MQHDKWQWVHPVETLYSQPVMPSSSDSAKRIAQEDPAAVTMRIDAPGRALRSATEIAKVLQVVCNEKLAISAYLEQGEVLFASVIRAVDLDLDRVVIDYSQWKPANTALMKRESVQFHCDRKKRHIQFQSVAPTQIMYEGAARLQLPIPPLVLDLQQRAHRRLVINSLPSLWCVINREDAAPIVANLADISRGGMGAFIHEPGIVLKPGMIFKHCQITGPTLKNPIDVGVEVRYWKTVREPDGTLNKRVGCRFVTASKHLRDLIEMFETEVKEDWGKL